MQTSLRCISAKVVKYNLVRRSRHLCCYKYKGRKAEASAGLGLSLTRCSFIKKTSLSVTTYCFFLTWCVQYYVPLSPPFMRVPLIPGSCASVLSVWVGPGMYILFVKDSYVKEMFICRHTHSLISLSYIVSGDLY